MSHLTRLEFHSDALLKFWTKPAIYKVEQPPFNELLLRKIADHFALKGDVTPMPQDLVRAPGYWIKEPNPTNALKWRCAVFSVGHGTVGYYSVDDGYRYDPLTRRHDIRGVPEKEEALVKALELLPLLNLSTNDLEHRHDGRLKWSSGGSEIGYFDRESNERRRTVIHRDISFFQRVPGGGATTGVGDGGQLRIGFVSDGKVADIECLFRKLVKVGEARPRTRKEIMSDIDRGRAWTWRANVPSSLSITNCAVAYPQGNGDFHQDDPLMPSVTRSMSKPPQGSAPAFFQSISRPHGRGTSVKRRCTRQPRLAARVGPGTPGSLFQSP